MLKKTKTLSLCGLFAAVMCLISPFTIQIGPVPLSLALFGVLLTGGLLPPLQAGAVQMVYLFLGLIGLPVFSGLQGGLQKLVGPTGGFLFAYPVCAVIISAALWRLGRGRWGATWRQYTLLIFAMIFGTVVLYTSGVLWYRYVSGAELSAALAVTVYPFAALELLRIPASAALCLLIRRRIMPPAVA